MGYSQKIRRKAISIIQTHRLDAEREAEYRKNKIYKEIPEAEKIEREISSCGIAAGRAVLKGGDVKAEIKKLKERNLTLQEEYKQLLLKGGYSIEDTEPQYTCKKCNDKGYVEIDNRTVECDCFKQTLIECACAELNRYSALTLCTFDDFSLEYYSTKIERNFSCSPYEQMKKILQYCKKYAESFDRHSESLLMSGKTGLGKTHLSLSIANEVIKKGYEVVYVSAPSLVSQLEKEHFTNNREDDNLDETLIDCDLLIIDDLGTEFATQFSNSEIYNIFNSRLLNHKPVIVNTNLTLQELEKQYSQRFVSRIVGQSTRLNFFGKDIRIIKKGLKKI
jgi:DNA replication protein DnaC